MHSSASVYHKAIRNAGYIGNERRAFTLIELIGAVSIVIVLAAILIPIIGTVRVAALTAKSVNNARQVAAALFQYANENDSALPPALQFNGMLFWTSHLSQYMGTPELSTSANGVFYNNLSRKNAIQDASVMALAERSPLSCPLARQWCAPLSLVIPSWAINGELYQPAPGVHKWESRPLLNQATDPASTILVSHSYYSASGQYYTGSSWIEPTNIARLVPLTSRGIVTAWADGHVTISAKEFLTDSKQGINGSNNIWSLQK